MHFYNRLPTEQSDCCDDDRRRTVLQAGASALIIGPFRRAFPLHRYCFMSASFLSVLLNKMTSVQSAGRMIITVNDLQLAAVLLVS